MESIRGILGHHCHMGILLGVFGQLCLPGMQRVRVRY